MFASSILEVVIGLLFVFFVCSLAVSGINEFVRKLLNTRAKALWTSINRMLDGSERAPQSEGITARLDNAPSRGPMLVDGGTPDDRADVSLAARLYDHPVIGRLDPTRLTAPSRITYIPPTDFARALVDILTRRTPTGTSSGTSSRTASVGCRVRCARSSSCSTKWPEAMSCSSGVRSKAGSTTP